MSDSLTRDGANLELADIWDEQAQGLEKFDSEDRAAKTLRMCAEDVRKTTEEHAQEWISHHTIRQRTGWSDVYLRRIYQGLRSSGQARKHRGQWEVVREAALEIQPKRGHEPLEGLSIPEMARALAS